MISSKEFRAKYASKSKGKRKAGSSANALTAAALQLLRPYGYVVWRQNNHATYDPIKQTYRKFTGMKGVPDIIGFCPKTGVFIAVEIKSGRDKVSDEQRRFLDSVREAGGFAVVCRDVGNLQIDLLEWRKSRN